MNTSCPCSCVLCCAVQGGKAFFTVPRMPIKCAGAPQKIMWMFEERMRDLGLRGNTSVTLVTSTPGIFGVPKYAAMLMKEKDARGVALTVTTDLVKVDAATKVRGVLWRGVRGPH